jgi:hypothetical protein
VQHDGLATEEEVSRRMRSFGFWWTMFGMVQLAILAAFVALAVFAGWKAFRWLRKWNP